MSIGFVEAAAFVVLMVWAGAAVWRYITLRNKPVVRYCIVHGCVMEEARSYGFTEFDTYTGIAKRTVTVKLRCPHVEEKRQVLLDGVYGQPYKSRCGETITLQTFIEDLPDKKGVCE